MRRYALLPLLLVFASAASCQTASPQQHAADQTKCAGYGYQPGTDQFANCMMKLDSRRQDQAASQQQNDADMKALSIKRNGDTRFPVCSAAMMDANLDTMNNAWYGPNCREK
jgi:predicted component of type VI protein secretion system